MGAPVTVTAQNQRDALAEKLSGLQGITRAHRGEYDKIYGPGVKVLPRGVKVKILKTQTNHNHPENPNGDIWCRIKDKFSGFEMWVPSTFIIVRDDK